MGMGAEEPKGSKKAGKSAKAMQQMFMRIAEPYFTPLIAAMASQAGITPYSMFGNAQGAGSQPQPGANPMQAPPPPPSGNAPTQAPPSPPATPAPQTAPGSLALGVGGAGVGQAASGVQRGAALAPGVMGAASGAQAGMKTGYKPVNPLPNPQQVYTPSGWTEADRIAFNQRNAVLGQQFENISNRAMHTAGMNTGSGASSIKAGLQAKIAREQGDATARLAQDTTLQGIQRQEQRMQQLLAALGMMFGFPAQAANINLGQAQMQQQAQMMQGQQLAAAIGGLGAFL